MKSAIRHYLNPLHIYCRLRDVRIPKGMARSLCVIYEHSIFRPLMMILS